MKSVLLAGIAICVAVALPAADESDLTGGVFICHHVPFIYPTPPYEEWCEAYEALHAITTCEEQNPRIDNTDPAIWFILATFAEDKSFCGTAFGFGEFDPYNFVFCDWGPCTHGGYLEIPTPWWPGPNQGTAVTITDLPWQGNFVPVYYFVGFAYYNLPGQIPVDVDPATGFGGFGNCLTPPEMFDAACFPTMGLLMDGSPCCPTWISGVCCVDEECYVITELECEEMQGEWHPEWDTCEPNPCPPVWFVCCVGEECFILPEQQCIDIQGEWHPEWDTCEPNPCISIPVCCVCEDCYVVTEEECSDLGGEWHPEWDGCDPNPCPASPAEETSWGTIKRLFR